MAATAIEIINTTITGPSTHNGAPVEATSTPLDVSGGSGTLRLDVLCTPAAGPYNGSIANWLCEVHIETAEDAAGSSGWRELALVRPRNSAKARISVGGADNFVRARWVFAGSKSATLAITGDMPTGA
jgi:hypothetical protein